MIIAIITATTVTESSIVVFRVCLITTRAWRVQLSDGDRRRRNVAIVAPKLFVSRLAGTWARVDRNRIGVICSVQNLIFRSRLTKKRVREIGVNCVSKPTAHRSAGLFYLRRIVTFERKHYIAIYIEKIYPRRFTFVVFFVKRVLDERRFQIQSATFLFFS